MATSDSSDAPGGGQVDERLAAVEEHLGQLERLVEVVTAIRADVATIAEGVDPALAAHVAELADTVEKHGLLLARLLDKIAGADDT